MTRVALEKMEFYAYHGYYDEEQIKGNNFVLDVYADIPTFNSQEDNIDDTVNYEYIYKVCEKHMIEKKYKLLETVALQIAKDIKAEYRNIYKVKVRLAKLNPPIPGKIGRAMIEYEL